MSDDKAKQLTLKWLSMMPVLKKCKRAMETEFRNALADRYNQLQNQIEQFVGFFNNNVKKGDEHIS